jgi:hypothetical protein
MNTSQILHQMCHEELSNADINAIRKNRGFSEQETASRALLENFLLSDTGVQDVLGALTEKEIVFLHLLKFVGQEVAIPLFTRLYDDVDRPNYGTYTQRYKPVFKKVRRALIRKGILLFAEDHSLWDADTKMERRRYRFPRQFERFLPPPIQSTKWLEGEGDIRTGILRQKLKEVIPNEPPVDVPDDVNGQYELKLVDGDLRIGTKPFCPIMLNLLKWQRACWTASVPPPERYAGKSKVKGVWRRERGPVVPPVEAAAYVFSQLEEKAWIRADQLSLSLRIFCDEAASSHVRSGVSGEEVCRTGWRWGYLAKQEADGVTYYRRAEKEAEPDTDPQYYLYAPDGCRYRDLIVNLETIPYQALEYLDQISDLRMADASGPCLAASPSLVKMGRSLAAIQQQPLTQWLRENAPAFRQALETVEQRWGKQIVHQDLFVAKVDDLGLKVQLERAFPDPRKVLFLPDDYIAFPRRMLTKVEKVVTEAGHVIRLVENDD